jgi:hypothetical protein
MSPRPFATIVLMPLFILLFVNLIEKKNLRYKIGTGVVLGLLGLTHLMSFASALLFVFVYVIYELVLSFKKKEVLKEFKELFELFSLVILIGFIVASPYIGPLIFHYKFNTLNDQPAYSSPIPGIQTITEFLKSTFFDTSSILRLLVTLLVLIGFVYAVLKTEYVKIPFLLLIATVVGNFHYLITIPIGIKTLVYWQLPIYTTPLARALLFTIGSNALINTLKNKEIKKYALMVLIVLLLGATVSTKTSFYNGRWITAGRNSNLGPLSDMADWVEKNTDKNDVFLSTKEGSFALFSLTGRKLVVNRITHASQFVDFDKREDGAAIMFYGNSVSEIKSLLKKYNVSYVYYDNQWLDSLQWDPFLVDPKNSLVLDKFGVQYDGVKARLDPGKPDVPVYDLLLIKYDKLWSDDFNKFVYPVMYWGDQKKPDIVIFAINKTMLMQ